MDNLNNLSLVQFAERYDFSKEHGYELSEDGHTLHLFADGGFHAEICKDEQGVSFEGDDVTWTGPDMKALCDFVEEEFEWSEFLLRPGG